VRGALSWESRAVAIRFGDCELSIDRRELRRDGEPVAMEPQVFDVLAHLVCNRERVVPKTELLDEVWGDRFVSESALTSRIKFARRAVGDTGRDQRAIKTIHGRGYRFVAGVETEAIATATDVGRSLSPDVAADADDPAKLLLGGLDSGIGAAVVFESPVIGRAMEVLDHMYDLAIDAGFHLGRGSAAGVGFRPYGCVIEVMDELLARAPGLIKQVPYGCQVEIERSLAGEPPSTRQRLFLAVRELLARAATERGVVVIFDDLDVASGETVALVNHMARLVERHRLVVAVTQRRGGRLDPRFEKITLGSETGDLDSGDLSWDLPGPMIEEFTAVAVATAGTRFDVADLSAASGLDRPNAEHVLDVALARGVVEPTVGGGYQFRDPELASRLVDAMAPHRRDAIRRAMATRLAAGGAVPERVAEHLLAAGDPVAAIPPALAAARRAADAHAHHEALRWTGAVLAHATGEDRRLLVTIRAQALAAIGDPGAIPAFRDALALTGPEGARSLRAGLARAAMFAGDLETAREALEGLEPDGGADDVAVALARGGLAYFTGQLDVAEEALGAVRGSVDGPLLPAMVLDAIALQGLIAHDRGEWFDRLRHELMATRDRPELAMTVFDSHLCVAEYLLYGPLPYAEVVSLAGELREQAEEAGARRATAFAVCLAGEAELLAGDLEAARRDLLTSVELHTALSADTGIAHSMQRLAEVELACGNPAEAERLLREALTLARWSPLAPHLLQRTYGTLIAAAPDAAAAVVTAEEALEILDGPSACEFCGVMVEIPAAIAFAQGGRFEQARSHLERAEEMAARWHGTAWQGAVAEAKAVLARAEGDDISSRRLFAEAAALFRQAGQVLDTERCREALDD
jgi:DNA-binding winged helix-turn-helix (wHTH) protein/tetratricopeptide (TPR) repeat protein